MENQEISQLELENEKRLKTLRAAYEMSVNTRKETETRMRDAVDNKGNKIYTEKDIKEQLDRIAIPEQEIVEEYVRRGGSESDLTGIGGKKRRKPVYAKADDQILDELKPVEKKEANKQELVSDSTREFVAPVSKGADENVQYDVIPLPSRGECYKCKKAQVPVAYLTAYDENMIVSPNLYRDNLIIDYMLNEKVKIDHSVLDPMDMLEGDRDAIILFLRASGYGNEYQITAKDQVTGKEFDTTVDLSRIKFKEFNLKGDENGWFDFALPVTKKQIKFRFLTHRDEKRLEQIEQSENIKVQKSRLADMAGSLNALLDVDNSLESTLKIKLRESVRNIEKWDESLKDEDVLPYTHMLTNRLEMSVMSIDGNMDRRFISNFVRNMNVRDSYSLRKYILENEPGVDYNITVQKPESLGGGSQKVFLQLDEYIFLNVS